MEKESITKTVIKNSFFQCLLGVISKIGGFIFTIIVARALFPELFGVYSLVLTIILIFVTFVDLGIGGTITRYISESIGKKTKGNNEARSRFLFLIKFRFITAFIGAILLFLLSSSIALWFKKPELALPLQIGSIYLFITSIYGLASGIFLAFQKLKYNLLIETIFQTSRIAVVFILLYFYKSVETIFIALIIALFFATTVSLIIINKKYKFLIKGKKKQVERRRILKFSGFLALSSLSMIFFGNIDKFMLGYFLSSEFVGYYTAIIAIVGGVLGLVGFGTVLFPVFTQLKETQLKTAFKKTFHYLAIITFPAAIGLSYIFIPAMQVFFGGAYIPLEYKSTLLITSIILSFLIIESVPSSIYIMLFNAREKPRAPALIMMIASFLNIVLNYIFILYFIKIRPEYGLIAVALATMLSRYILLFSLAILSNKKFKIVPDKNSIVKPLMSSIIMLIFLFIFDYFVNINILTGIVMILLAALIYFFVLFLIKGIKKEDFELIKMLVG